MEDDEEYVLLTIDQVFVFKVPPRPSAGGYRAKDWTDQVWTGMLKVVSRGDQAAIKLITRETQKLFAVCMVRPDGKTVEKASDSSRYFVLRIEDGKGNHAFIGLGFQVRGDAFDFKNALQEHTAEVERRKNPVKLDLGPSKDFSLKSGETIRINVPLSGKKKSSKSKSGGGGGLSGGFGLAPPKPAGRSKFGGAAPTGLSATAAAPAPAAAPLFTPASSAPAPAPAPAAAASSGFSGDPFGNADPFANSDPFADPFAAATPAASADPFAAAPAPAPASSDDPLGLF